LAAEVFANNASSTLNGAILSSDATLVVQSAASFPTSGNFRILIDSEYLLVTAVSGTTFTVSRGQEGTSAAGHASGAPVTHVATAAGIVQGMRDHAPCQPPQYGNCSSDLAIHTADTTFTDILTVNATGTAHLLQAMAAGLSDGACTARLRILVDGSEVNYLGNYGSTVGGSGSGVNAIVLGVVTGLSNASHAFKLQGSYGGSTGWTIHASTNPKRENAWLVVTPLT
jgi:hypothetical protein